MVHQWLHPHCTKTTALEGSEEPPAAKVASALHKISTRHGSSTVPNAHANTSHPQFQVKDIYLPYSVTRSLPVDDSVAPVTALSSHCTPNSILLFVARI